MKKVCWLLVVLVLLTSTAYAENWIKYTIDAMNVEVLMPENYIVFQKNKGSSEKDLKMVGATEKEIQQRFVDNEIYLTAFSLDGNVIIDIALEKNDNQDISELTDDKMNELMDTLVRSDLENGIVVNKSEIYYGDNLEFIELDETISEYRRISFFSSKDGITIHICALTTEEYYRQIKLEDRMNMIADGIKFIEYEGIHYLDDDLDIEFVVPSGWREIKFDKEGSNFTAKFISEDGKKMKIEYKRADMWTSIPDLEKEGITRRDINNSLFSKADIAEWFGVTADSVKTKKYGENEYYICDSRITTSNGKMWIRDTFATTMQDGYIVSFVFSGSEEHELYKDFEKVLESLKILP